MRAHPNSMEDTLLRRRFSDYTKFRQFTLFECHF